MISVWPHPYKSQMLKNGMQHFDLLFSIKGLTLPGIVLFGALCLL